MATMASRMASTICRACSPRLPATFPWPRSCRWCATSTLDRPSSGIRRRGYHRPAPDPFRAGAGRGRCVGYEAFGLITAGPSGGKAGPPSERFMTVQDSHMPRPANTKVM